MKIMLVVSVLMFSALSVDAMPRLCGQRNTTIEEIEGHQGYLECCVNTAGGRRYVQSRIRNTQRELAKIERQDIECPE